MKLVVVHCAFDFFWLPFFVVFGFFFSPPSLYLLATIFNNNNTKLTLLALVLFRVIIMAKLFDYTFLFFCLLLDDG